MTPIIEKSIAIDGHIFAERRASSRRRVFKGGRLSFNRGYGALECVVRNLSDAGARLSFGETSAVPAHFDLLIAGEDTARPVSLRWRSAREVGVSFD